MATRGFFWPKALVSVSLLASTVTACSWAPFDELEKDTPVVLFERSAKIKRGFGSSLAAASDGSKSHIAVSGTPGASPASVFELTKNGAVLGRDAVSSSGCDPDNECGIAEQVAGLNRARAGAADRDLCFILGFGLSATERKTKGLVGLCADGTEYSLKVPLEARRAIEDDFDLNREHQPLFLASDKDDAPALVAGSPNQGVAWFYAPLSPLAVSLERPNIANLEALEQEKEFGSSVAAVRLESGRTGARIYAVGAPKSDHVWLFRSDEPTQVGRIGCLGGTERFGRALASGDVDGDGVDELVISDQTNVHVIDGAALGRLPYTTSTSCGFASLPEAGLIASFSCGSRFAVTGCDDSDFGAALAVGDLDGDGDGEVIVGAPEMEVRGNAKAGAVLVYDVDDVDKNFALTDVLFLSSAEKNDLLGSSLTVIQLADRALVAAGAPESGKAGVFFCSALADDSGDARCQ